MHPGAGPGLEPDDVLERCAVGAYAGPALVVELGREGAQRLAGPAGEDEITDVAPARTPAQRVSDPGQGAVARHEREVGDRGVGATRRGLEGHPQRRHVPGAERQRAEGVLDVERVSVAAAGDVGDQRTVRHRRDGHVRKALCDAGGLRPVPRRLGGDDEAGEHRGGGVGVGRAGLDRGGLGAAVQADQRAGDARVDPRAGAQLGGAPIPRERVGEQPARRERPLAGLLEGEAEVGVGRAAPRGRRAREPPLQDAERRERPPDQPALVGLVAGQQGRQLQQRSVGLELADDPAGRHVARARRDRAGALLRDDVVARLVVGGHQQQQVQLRVAAAAGSRAVEHRVADCPGVEVGGGRRAPERVRLRPGRQAHELPAERRRGRGLRGVQARGQAVENRLQGAVAVGVGREAELPADGGGGDLVRVVAGGQQGEHPPGARAADECDGQRLDVARRRRGAPGGGDRQAAQRAAGPAGVRGQVVGRRGRHGEGVGSEARHDRQREQQHDAEEHGDRDP